MQPEFIQSIIDDAEKNKNWKDFIKRFNVDAKKKGFFQGATFELTSFCTLKCPMCFVRRDRQSPELMGGRMRTAEEWIEMARQFRDQGGIFLLLTGGEAMMRPDFAEIYEEISKMGLLVSLFTNGTTVDDKMIELFKRRPPSMMGLTLYGASQEVYSRFGGGEGSFQRALGGLDRLLTIPNLALEVRFTACTENYKELKEVFKLALERKKVLNFDQGSCAPVRGACSNTRKLRLNKAQMEEVDETLKEMLAPITESTKKLKKLEEKIDNKIKIEEEEELNRGLTCMGGKNSVYIAWDGRMYPCDMAEFPYAFPFEQGFKEAAFDIRDQIDSLIMPRRCLGCVNHEIYCQCVPKALNEMRDCARMGEKCDYIPKDNGNKAYNIK